MREEVRQALDILNQLKEEELFQENKKQMNSLIHDILLPIRFLIKHYAFKEEQECRAIYIAKWGDPRILLDRDRNRVYVDYRSILPAIEKIYVPTGALQHQGALQYLGKTAVKKFKVKQSHNPFRQF